MIALRLLAALVGAAVVVGTVLSAMRTVVVPRAVPVRITDTVFTTTRSAFDLIARRYAYEGRDRIMASYAATSLLLLPFVWFVATALGFAAVYWALDPSSAWDALELSGSSLLTLGFAPPESRPASLVAFVQAGLGMAILALLLVTYLPSMYAAFSRREQAVTLLETRAGSPPTGIELLVRYARIHGLDQLDPVWRSWESWFADVQESHTSLPALVFFRSPDPRMSWVTAAGALLDAAALYVSCVDFPRILDHREIRHPNAETCIRSGYLSLRAVASSQRIEHDPDPRPDDPISIRHEEFEQALDTMTAAGVPIVADREAAWRAFAGWRVNYDAVLCGLADLVMVPPTPWVSDGRPHGGPARRSAAVDAR